MAKTQKAVERLLDEGWFDTPREAAAWILSGQVYCGGARVASAGQRVALDKPLAVRGREMPYVGKGGLKLAGALDDFGIDVRGRVCVDVGASTGGFTDCLQKRGAARVYAVDVGFGQLAGSLRQNERVVNLEKTNVSDDKLLALNPRPDLGTVDVSYLSLRKAAPAFAAILHGRGELVCLVKPLFEIDDSQARRTGVIAPGAYAPLLRALVQDLERENDLSVRGVTNSAVTGNGGTIEFFLHLRLGDAGRLDHAAAIDAAVSRALALAKYRPDAPLA